MILYKKIRTIILLTFCIQNSYLTIQASNNLTKDNPLIKFPAYNALPGQDRVRSILYNNGYETFYKATPIRLLSNKTLRKNDLVAIINTCIDEYKLLFTQNTNRRLSPPPKSEHILELLLSQAEKITEDEWNTQNDPINTTPAMQSKDNNTTKGDFGSNWNPFQASPIITTACIFSVQEN